MEGDFEVNIEFLKVLALYAGSFMLNAQSSEKKISTKTNESDLVTETDVSIETELKSRISKRYPEHKFLCEETENQQKLTDLPTWIIDPIDGTTNFIHKFPFYCVSIGFSRNKTILLGCVYIPYMNELFYAIKNGGAYLNNTRIKVSNCTQISKALLFTSLNASKLHEDLNTTIQLDNSLEKKYIMDRNFDNLKCVIPKVRDIRQLGASAVELSYLACGRCDILFQFGPHEWDVAAGILLIQEAGGYISDIDGSEYVDIGSLRILAAASFDLAKSLSSLIRL